MPPDEGQGQRGAGRRPAGLLLIILYKLGKAVAQLLLAATLVVLAATGELAALRELASALRENVASRWSLASGRLLSTVLSERGIHLVEFGLVLDAILSAVEGWSLWMGYRWGAWLVVAATATPLPLEILEIARAHRPSRIALAVANLAIVVYLCRRLAARRPHAI